MRRIEPPTGITAFAGSLSFVYIHAVWFGLWIAVNVGVLGRAAEFDNFPFGLLTMIVSLEAIFLADVRDGEPEPPGARADMRAQLDFETNLRSEIWSVHIGHALGIDVDHVEDIVLHAIEGSRVNLATGPPAVGGRPVGKTHRFVRQDSGG